MQICLLFDELAQITIGCCYMFGVNLFQPNMYNHNLGVGVMYFIKIILLVLLLASLLACISVVAIKRKEYKRNEQQIKAQISAYKKAFIFFILYNIFYSF